MSGQFWWTTADIERHSFYGEWSPSAFVGIDRASPQEFSGQYRVVAGGLYRIESGAPPAMTTPGEDPD